MNGLFVFLVLGRYWWADPERPTMPQIVLWWGVAEGLESAREFFEGFEASFLICFSVVGVFADGPTIPPKSSTPPGVFGVFEDPNEANAPDPRPNAFDAPAVGDEMVEVESVLKGFLVLCEEVSPVCLLFNV